MTDTPTMPPAGWYPAPDGSATSWWWDGAEWVHSPTHAQPQAQQAAGQHPASADALAKLATATQVLLVIHGVISVGYIGVETFGINAVTDFLTGDPLAIDRIDLYDLGSPVVSLLSVVSILATAVLWAVWQYRAARHLVGRTRRSPGWHAGSWFVPIVSFWFPYQNISDLWRATGRARPSWLLAWWLLWVAGNLVNQISGRSFLGAVDLEQFRVAMWTSITGEFLMLAAAALAWLVVRGITQGIREQSAAPVERSAV